MTRWRYRLYGLETETAIDLGALPLGDPSLPCDAEIVVGHVPQLDNANDIWFENRNGNIILDLAPSGRFLIEDGAKITVDDAQAGLAALRWRLLGIAFGAVLHQRGVLPLHATVVAIDGRNVALTGASGAGKSTLAAFLRNRGHHVLIDDVCAVVPDTADRVIVEPGNGLLRLWDDAMNALGTNGGERLDPDIAKFEHASPVGRDRVTLDALVEIGDGDDIAVTALGAGNRIALCLRHSYCRDILMSLGGRDRNLQQCATVATTLPMFRLSRPRGFERMADVIAALEAATGGLA